MLALFSPLHITNPISNPGMVYWQVQGWAPFLTQRVGWKCQAVDWDGLTAFPRAGSTSPPALPGGFSFRGWVSHALGMFRFTKTVEAESQQSPAYGHNWLQVHVNQTRNSCVHQPLPQSFPLVLEAFPALFLAFLPSLLLCSSVVPSSVPSLSPWLCLLLSARDINFSPTHEAFQGPTEPQMHPGLSAPLIKERVNKPYFGAVPVFLQGASPGASFPLKQWIRGSDNAFANCTHYLFSTICYKFSPIIVVLLNK